MENDSERKAMSFSKVSHSHCLVDTSLLAHCDGRIWCTYSLSGESACQALVSSLQTLSDKVCPVPHSDNYFVIRPNWALSYCERCGSGAHNRWPLSVARGACVTTGFDSGGASLFPVLSFSWLPMQVPLTASLDAQSVAFCFL